MHKQKKYLLWLIITLLVSTFHRPGFAQDVSTSGGEIIIVHPANPTKTLTLNQARTIFSMRARQWPNGTPITVVVLNDQSPIHKAFLRNVLRILPHQLRRNWDRYIYAGIGQGPMVVDDPLEMIEMVEKIPGAIGYIEKGVPHEQVLTLTIR